MIDYFLLADDASLRAMGVERKRLPSKEACCARSLPIMKSQMTKRIGFI
jgi:hypothetical protein